MCDIPSEAVVPRSDLTCKPTFLGQFNGFDRIRECFLEKNVKADLKVEMVALLREMERGVTGHVGNQVMFCSDFACARTI